MKSLQSPPYGKSRSRHKSLRTNEAWDKVVRTIENLKLQRNLSDAQTKCVREIVDVLKTTQISDRRKKYKRFLFNVLRESDFQAILVCVTALDQVKTTNMKEFDRNLLNRKIESCKNINHSTIQSLASRYQIFRFESDVSLSLLWRSHWLLIDVLACVSSLSQDMIERHQERSQFITNSSDSITSLRIERRDRFVSSFYFSLLTS